jgi:hypothetical protein
MCVCVCVCAEVRVKLADLPEVPDGQRPKSVYVDTDAASSVIKTLASRGWEVKDVRLLDGPEAVRGTLAGIRMGTIDPKGQSHIRYLELEAKVHGLLSSKGPNDMFATKNSFDDSIDGLLDFGPETDFDAFFNVEHAAADEGADGLPEIEHANPTSKRRVRRDKGATS